MATLRSNLIRIAHTLPSGDAGREDILHVLREDTFRLAFSKLAAKKKEELPPVLVKGYDGFADQVRALEAADSEVKRLKAEIEAATGGILPKLKAAEKDYTKAVDTIKKEYKENLTAQGTVIVERKTSLIEAMVQLQITPVKGNLDSVQEALLAKVTEKYGAEVAEFIKVTTESLRDQNKIMRASLDGFSLEMRAGKTAGVADALGKFRDFFMKGWKKLVEVTKAATKLVLGQGKKVEKAHTAFMKAFDNAASGATV